MTAIDLAGLLAQHKSLGSAPLAEREWLIKHGTPLSLAVGDVITHKGERAKSLHIYLSGHVVIRADGGAGAHKVFEWHGGDVGGLLPFSRGTNPPNDAVAEAPTEVLDVPQESFRELIRECPVVTNIMVWAMLDRARQFTDNDRRDEKLISLGRLAAGLAHELNNPASALVRSAKLLAASLDGAESAARRLGAAGLLEAQLSAIDAVRAVCRSPSTNTSTSTNSSTNTARSPLSLADREDSIASWLSAHGGTESCAGALAETGVTLVELDQLAAVVKGDALDAALQWIAAGCSVRALTTEIETAATRIHDLVGSVKGFTYMDSAPTPQPVDIRRGIADTLTMLGAKTRAKRAHIAHVVDDDLPRAHAVGGELNQVWMNLIDNALDAIGEGGNVTVTARGERGRVVVTIIDDGAGIPPEIRERIFEPFFTTKGVGKGTGLGLDIVRRLVQRHEGEIEVESRPGRTEFRVSLPAEK